MNVLTMTIEEIYQLNNVTITEDEYFINVTPDTDYYLDVEDYPQHKIYYDTLQMLKLARYSNIVVKGMYDPSTDTMADSSILNVSI